MNIVPCLAIKDIFKEPDVIYVMNQTGNLLLAQLHTSYERATVAAEVGIQPGITLQKLLPRENNQYNYL